MNFIPTFYPKVKYLIIFARLLSPKQPAMRVKMTVACSGSPPRWWGNQSVWLTGFRLTDKNGKVSQLRQGYFGWSRPEQPSHVNCMIEYTLPARVAGQNLSAINCTLVTATSHEIGPDVPLAGVKIKLAPQLYNALPMSGTKNATIKK